MGDGGRNCNQIRDIERLDEAMNWMLTRLLGGRNKRHVGAAITAEYFSHKRADKPPRTCDQNPHTAVPKKASEVLVEL
jgi:hypothetical protein